MSVSLPTFVEAMHSRLAAVESKLGLPSPAQAPGLSAAGAGSAALAAYDAFYSEKVTPFLNASKNIGGKAEKLGQAVDACYGELRAILVMASESKKPAGADFMANLNKAIGEVGKLKERDAFENHAKAVSEGIGALSWVNPANMTPGPFVGEMGEASVFWMNKVRNEQKGKEGGDLHVQWCKDLDAMWKGLQAFVKAEQPTGVTWNAKGKDASGPPAAASSASSSGGGGGGDGGGASKAAASGAAAANLFAELGKIDQSSGKTAGLKHVTKDMKASANKDKPAVEAKAPASKKKEAEAPKVQVFALQGNKWVVEGQTKMIEIPGEQLTVKNTIYIFNCVGATIVVPGKVNTITIDGCKNCSIVFQDVLAMCEIVNSKSCKIQCKGKSPTIAIDKTDGVVVYLSREAMAETKVVASKSSEMNMSWPGKTDDDPWVEKVIPVRLGFDECQMDGGH